MAAVVRPMVSAGQFSEITFDQNLGSASWVGVTTRVQSASNGSCNMAAVATPMMSAGQFSEITFDQNLGTASWVGVTTRVQSASNGSCYLAIAYNGGVWLYRTDDTGTLNWTQLATANVDITVAPRDLRLESQGATHRVYFNGVQLISYTESVQVYTTGQPGVAVYQNASTAKILTFTGGSLSGSTAPAISSAKQRDVYGWHGRELRDNDDGDTDAFGGGDGHAAQRRNVPR